MAFNFIEISPSQEVPIIEKLVFTAQIKTNVTYALCTNPTSQPIELNIYVGENIDLLAPILTKKVIANYDTYLCNELKGMILNENESLYIKGSLGGLWFRANGFTFN